VAAVLSVAAAVETATTVRNRAISLATAPRSVRAATAADVAVDTAVAVTEADVGAAAVVAAHSATDAKNMVTWPAIALSDLWSLGTNLKLSRNSPQEDGAFLF